MNKIKQMPTLSVFSQKWLHIIHLLLLIVVNMFNTAVKIANMIMNSKSLLMINIIMIKIILTNMIMVIVITVMMMMMAVKILNCGNLFDSTLFDRDWAPSRSKHKWSPKTQVITKTSSCQWFHSRPRHHHHNCLPCCDDHHQKDNHQSGRVLVLSCDAASIQRTETSSASLQFRRYPGKQIF